MTRRLMDWRSTAVRSVRQRTVSQGVMRAKFQYLVSKDLIGKLHRVGPIVGIYEHDRGSGLHDANQFSEGPLRIREVLEGPVRPAAVHESGRERQRLCVRHDGRL